MFFVFWRKQFVSTSSFIKMFADIINNTLLQDDLPPKWKTNFHIIKKTDIADKHNNQPSAPLLIFPPQWIYAIRDFNIVKIYAAVNY